MKHKLVQSSKVSLPLVNNKMRKVRSMASMDLSLVSETSSFDTFPNNNKRRKSLMSAHFGDSLSSETRDSSKILKFRSAVDLEIVKNRFLPPTSLDAFIEDSYVRVASKINNAVSCGWYALCGIKPSRSASELSSSQYPASASTSSPSCASTQPSPTPDTPAPTSCCNPDGICDSAETSLMEFSRLIRPLRLSVLILLVATFTDAARNSAYSPIPAYESPIECFDELSTEVIRPPCLYKKEPSKTKTLKRAGLGWAAISSIMTGVDIRRQEHWEHPKNFIKNVAGAVVQIRDGFRKEQSSPLSPVVKSTSGVLEQIPRSGGQVPKQFASHTKSGKKWTSVIGATAPFVSPDAIAELTLGDVSTLFRYVIESSRHNFNEKKFYGTVLPRVKSVLVAIDNVASRSRGNDVKPSRIGLTPSKTEPQGGVDALKFCAAMRIFAEWRLVRQVPEGYKGYAVGMNLGHKDIVQNVAKIEQSAHSWIDVRRGKQQKHAGMDELRSPTLAELLSFEVEMDVHPNSKLPVLKDKTAAMGLLWVRRQLDYQSALLVNILKVPEKYRTTREAIEAAYTQVFDRYHGWAIQKIFTYSFQAAPEAEDIFVYMNPHRRKIVEQEFHARACPSFDAVPELPQGHQKWKDGFIDNVGNGWGKLLGRQKHVVDKPSQVAVSRGGSNERDVICVTDSQSSLDNFIVQEMTKDAHENIVDYLSVVQPFLSDLSRLIDDHNMNDPTKV